MNSVIGLLQVELKTKREFLPEVIELLGDALRRPRLDAEELEVIRRQIVTSLEQSTTEPQALAPRSVRKRLSPYGPDDIRYVMSIEEEIEMYNEVSVQEIRSLHANFLSNQAGEVSIVGDFDSDEVLSMLKSQLADWETSQPYVRVDKDPHPEFDGSLDSIEAPDKANAFFYCSQHHGLNKHTVIKKGAFLHI
jgi:zinc protease